MTAKMQLQSMFNPMGFISEVARSNGAESMQVVWARNTVMEAKSALKKMDEKQRAALWAAYKEI